MKNRRRICAVIAIILLIAITVSGITVTGISFGKKVNTRKEQIYYEDTQLTDNSITATESVAETDVVTDVEITYPNFNEYYGEEAEGVPDEVLTFAYDNNLSLDSWPDSVVEMLIKYPETEDFVVNYPLLKDKNFQIDVSDCGYETEIPLFLQWDKRWGYITYGDDLIANAGCGPTCLSMVATYLLQDPTLDPKTLCKFSTENGYCSPGYGTEWSFMSEGARQLGLNALGFEKDKYSVINYLSSGYPVICLVSEGDFTYGAHFIVLTDYVDGKIKINDPNSRINSEKLWDYEEIADQIDLLWAYWV